MKINKSLVFVLVFIFILIGCTQNDNTDNKIESAYDDLPRISAVFKVNNTDHEMIAGGFSWEITKGSTRTVMQTDAASPNQIAEELQAVKIEPQEVIEIVIEESPDLEIYLWNEEKRLDKEELSDNTFTASSDKGNYIYEVIGKWLEGERSYTFLIEVE